MIEINANRAISPSVMCADHDRLGAEIRELDAAGADMFHLDVMDGLFVPNFGVSPAVVKTARKNTDKPLDAHLMIADPARYVKFYAKLGCDIIYIHPETDNNAARTLSSISEAGALPGVAVNPGTSLAFVKELLPLVRYVLIMTVNPGFAGQKFLDFTTEKIAAFGQAKKTYGYRLALDGNILPNRMDSLTKLGADTFVVGNFMFDGKSGYAEKIKEFKNG